MNQGAQGGWSDYVLPIAALGAGIVSPEAGRAFGNTWVMLEHMNRRRADEAKLLREQESQEAMATQLEGMYGLTGLGRMAPGTQVNFANLVLSDRERLRKQSEDQSKRTGLAQQWTAPFLEQRSLDFAPAETFGPPSAAEDHDRALKRFQGPPPAPTGPEARIVEDPTTTPGEAALSPVEQAAVEGLRQYPPPVPLPENRQPPDAPPGALRWQPPPAEEAPTYPPAFPPSVEQGVQDFLSPGPLQANQPAPYTRLPDQDVPLYQAISKGAEVTPEGAARMTGRTMEDFPGGQEAALKLAKLQREAEGAGSVSWHTTYDPSGKLHMTPTSPGGVGAPVPVPGMVRPQEAWQHIDSMTQQLIALQRGGVPDTDARVQDLQQRINTLRSFSVPPGGEIRGPAGGSPLAIGQKLPLGSDATAMVIGAERAKRAIGLVVTAATDPIVQHYLGPYGQYLARAQRSAPYAALGEVPEPVVQLEQNLSVVKNYVIKLITGAQMAREEVPRIMGELADMSYPPREFAIRLKQTADNITSMEGRVKELALRGHPAAKQMAEEEGLIPKAAPQAPGAGRAPTRDEVDQAKQMAGGDARKAAAILQGMGIDLDQRVLERDEDLGPFDAAAAPEAPPTVAQPLRRAPWPPPDDTEAPAAPPRMLFRPGRGSVPAEGVRTMQNEGTVPIVVNVRAPDGTITQVAVPAGGSINFPAGYTLAD